jgi:ATP-binding cassette subfamily B protein
MTPDPGSVRGAARLFPFARRFWRWRGRLALAFTFVPISQLADVGITVTVGRALNRLESGEADPRLAQAFALVLALAALHGVLRFATRYWIGSASGLFVRELKQELFDRIVRLPLAFHDRSRSGDLVSRLTSDVENLRMFLGSGLMYTGGALVILPVGLGVLFLIDPLLTGVMVVPLLGIAVMMRALGPRIFAASKAVQESQGDIAHRAQDDFAGIRIVKGYAREAESARRFAEASRANLANQLVLARVRGIGHAGVQGFFLFTFAAIVALGGWGLVEGRLRVGDLFQFLDLTLKMFWPLISIGWLAGTYPRAAASAERLTELLALEPAIADPADPEPLDRARGALELEDVRFTYEGANRPALQGIRASVPAGGTLAVVGPTGAGKSTLLALLGRLYEAEGTIRLDGHPIRRVRLADLRRQLGYVPQDGFLFSDTWRANAGFGLDEPLDDAEAARLAELASLTEEVAAFPGGYDQLIGERGVTLSGGQRQRTCIARALARDPRVLVLDDCLSAVDTETEARLLANLRAAGHGRTVVVAAHRLSSVAAADEILVLGRDGRIADRGTHAQLAARPGWYRDTWIAQQRHEELEQA